jgi:uncharacterized protein YgbK (DUF1537 family)
VTTNLLLTYYGDDFTGSTDVMEALTLGGLKAALFLQPPTPAQLARFQGLRAFGVAGVTRSMPPAQMEQELRPAFQQLAAYGAPIIHYKICSTFDSSPEIGSIGCAIDVGQSVYRSPFVPLIVGATQLKRYVVFGNLFASVGGVTYRLDRHPTMSRHPITPMAESDLRLHLAQQTSRSIGLVDILTLAQGVDATSAVLDAALAGGAELVLFDTVDEQHLACVCETLWRRRSAQPLFVVGSSGVEVGLTAYLRGAGLIEPPPKLTAPGPVRQLLVMSGSAAPTTASQIEWASQQGFRLMRLATERLIDPAQARLAAAETVERALDSLNAGDSVVLFSALGPDDPALHATRAHAATSGAPEAEIGQRLAQRQGEILRAILERHPLPRVCVAGGDTSGYAARALGVFALEMIMPVAPGAPLCRASSSVAAFDGLQVSLKGGQNGAADYFGRIQRGAIA